MVVSSWASIHKAPSSIPMTIFEVFLTRGFYGWRNTRKNLSNGRYVKAPMLKHSIRSSSRDYSAFMEVCDYLNIPIAFSGSAETKGGTLQKLKKKKKKKKKKKHI